jgi:hypothetical protein
MTCAVRTYVRTYARPTEGPAPSPYVVSRYTPKADPDRNDRLLAALGGLLEAVEHLPMLSGSGRAAPDRVCERPPTVSSRMAVPAATNPRLPVAGAMTGREPGLMTGIEAMAAASEPW